jgi:hypothetical protein
MCANRITLAPRDGIVANPAMMKSLDRLKLMEQCFVLPPATECGPHFPKTKSVTFPFHFSLHKKKILNWMSFDLNGDYPRG